VGDEVFYAGAVDRQGSYAELQVVDERLVGHKPTTLNFAQAVALPLTALTAWELLFDRFNAPFGKPGQSGTLLVVGGAGGVGSMAVQLGRRLTSLTVIATASRPETQDWVKGFGAHHVVDHRQSISDQVRPFAPMGVDYIMSLTHTDTHFTELAELLAPQGHFGLIDDPGVIPNINLLKTKSASIHWEWMFVRARHQTRDMVRQSQILNEVSELIDAGVLRTTFNQDLGSINAANLKRAHALVESGRSVGKTVLSGF
jgi:zinc-binding alcohol dehydrogenase family protein